MMPYPNFRDLERDAGITWLDLVGLEPRLEELLWRTRQACGACRRQSDVDQAFGPIRNTLVDLVGSSAKQHRHRVLGSVEAYQVAYWKLYDAAVALLPGRAGADVALERQRAAIVAGMAFGDAPTRRAG